MNHAIRCFACLTVLIGCGCSSPGAIFVTKTSLAVADVDNTPPETTFAMHRVEGFIAPRNRNGDTPPVLAHIQSNRALLSPNVQQVYATGSAAERLAGDPNGANSTCSTCPKPAGSVAPLVFTTSTTVGLRIGVATTGVVDGFVLGFRRKEMSFVPVLAEDPDGNYHYPSLMAAINLGEGEGPKGGGSPADAVKEFRSCQGFATGTAATTLATRVRNGEDSTFGCLEDSVRQKLISQASSKHRQQAEVAQVLKCYVALPSERRPAARADAQRLGLIDPTFKLIPAASPAGDDSGYATQLLAVTERPAGAGGNEGNIRLLSAHRSLVCGD